jgi:diguanylate cyclase (GGDEF)-like protein
VAKSQTRLRRRTASPGKLRLADDATTARERSVVPVGRDQPSPRGSEVMRLVAEVEALKAELETARARMRELEIRADVDPLLDIFNRRGFERELTRALAYVKRYSTSAALLYLDLDGFKPINDRFGHAAGDAVLRQIAAALTRHVRASDIVARIGGDEFAMLLWNLSEEHAARKAEALETLIAGTGIQIDADELRVGASVGVAMLTPLDGAPQVMARADQAMYARKAARGSGRSS